MKEHIVKITTKCIHGPNTLVGEVILGVFPSIKCGKYRLFLMIFSLYTPFFSIYNKPFRTQKPESHITIIPVPCRFLVRCNIKYTFFHHSEPFGGVGVLQVHTYHQLTQQK